MSFVLKYVESDTTHYFRPTIFLSVYEKKTGKDMRF